MSVLCPSATAITSIYPLSLHDALPISILAQLKRADGRVVLREIRGDRFVSVTGRELLDQIQLVRTFIRRSGVQPGDRSEEHTSELQSLRHLVCRLLLEKKNILRFGIRD